MIIRPCALPLIFFCFAPGLLLGQIDVGSQLEISKALNGPHRQEALSELLDQIDSSREKIEVAPELILALRNIVLSCQEPDLDSYLAMQCLARLGKNGIELTRFIETEFRGRALFELQSLQVLSASLTSFDLGGRTGTSYLMGEFGKLSENAKDLLETADRTPGLALMIATHFADLTIQRDYVERELDDLELALTGDFPDIVQIGVLWVLASFGEDSFKKTSSVKNLLKSKNSYVRFYAAVAISKACPPNRFEKTVLGLELPTDLKNKLNAIRAQDLRERSEMLNSVHFESDVKELLQSENSFERRFGLRAILSKGEIPEGLYSVIFNMGKSESKLELDLIARAKLLLK